MGFLVGHRRMIYINFKQAGPDYQKGKDFRKLDR
ncbi:hypothetical protein DES38_10635 [Streptohalobacillus salinus]|uniref:Uncharacterized protein n=1 Tax=Streptohalobacillus salinus TaxID=621096 RepID=A0A2V3WD25_9BACI|nr:hypothetical protein DES38_10635 [Streptohalobacillus salinus]